MRTRLLLLIALLASAPGCGTVVTQLSMDSRGHCPDPRCGVVTSPVYSGVVWDWRGMIVPENDRAHVYDIIFLVDLPISAVADTLILPYTYHRKERIRAGGWFRSDVDLTMEQRRHYAGRLPREHVGFRLRKAKDLEWSSPPEHQGAFSATLYAEGLTGTHTAFGTVLCARLTVPVDTVEDLKASVDREMKNTAPRNEFLDGRSSISTWKGFPCVRYAYRLLDKEVPNVDHPLVMTFDGVAFLHPLAEGYVVDIWFSERGTEEELGKGTAGYRDDLFRLVEVTPVEP